MAETTKARQDTQVAGSARKPGQPRESAASKQPGEPEQPKNLQKPRAERNIDWEASPQLALHLRLDEETTLENFLARDAIAALLAALNSPAAEALQYMHGNHAVGKSHLLQGLCHAIEGSVYLPLDELQEAPPAALFDELEHATLVALDDLQLIAGVEDWELALFHFINRARAAQCPVWVAARQPASRLGVQLADLRSRLAGGITWAIPEADDAGKAEILRFRARQRGLTLSPAVVNYLSTRGSRSLGDLMQTLARLDRASLQQQRPLTVPLLRDVLGW